MNIPPYKNFRFLSSNGISPPLWETDENNILTVPIEDSRIPFFDKHIYCMVALGHGKYFIRPFFYSNPKVPKELKELSLKVSRSFVRGDTEYTDNDIRKYLKEIQWS